MTRAEEQELSDYIKDIEEESNKLLKAPAKNPNKNISLDIEGKRKKWKEVTLHRQYPKLTKKWNKMMQYNLIKKKYMQKRSEESSATNKI